MKLRRYIFHFLIALTSSLAIAQDREEDLALVAAVQAGDLTQVREALRAGANIQWIKNAADLTPLEMARAQNQDVIGDLLEAVAAVLTEKMARAIESGDEIAVEYLRARGALFAAVDSKGRLLWQLAEESPSQAIRELAWRSRQTLFSRAVFMPPWRQAIQSGDVRRLDQLYCMVVPHAHFVNMRDDAGRTLLHIAAATESLDIVEWFVRHGFATLCYDFDQTMPWVSANGNVPAQWYLFILTQRILDRMPDARELVGSPMRTLSTVTVEPAPRRPPGRRGLHLEAGFLNTGVGKVLK